jgi:hypothetical protein
MLAVALRLTEGGYKALPRSGPPAPFILFAWFDLKIWFASIATIFSISMHHLARTITIRGNHYHLQVDAPKANLSQAIQWLNLSYTVWFNRLNNRVGPLFQGRFKAVKIDA